VITDLLPSFLEFQGLNTRRSANRPREERSPPKSCETGAVPLRCEFPVSVLPGQSVHVNIGVSVKAGAPEIGSNEVEVFEGGSSSAVAHLTTPISVAPTPPPFGPTSLETLASGLDGRPDTQAGGHPNEFTTRFDLNGAFRLGPETVSVLATSVEDPRDAVVELPLGFLGSAVATPRCKFSQLNATNSVLGAGCPLNTQIGHIYSEPGGNASINGGIYNMVPERGVAAEFGFADLLNNSHVIYSEVVPTAVGYVLRARSPEITQVALGTVTAAFFGDPAERDSELRQQELEFELRESGIEEPIVPREQGQTQVALFTNPSDCSGSPLQSSIEVDSWLHPGALLADGSPDLSDPDWAGAAYTAPPVTGCAALHFQPTIAAATDTAQADSPTGFEVDLKVPQTTDPRALATPPLRDAVISLPPGLVVNPSSANGLAACSEAQLGISAADVPNAEVPSCPDASKLGTVSLETPLLPGTLTGQIYLARQSENPFGSLLAIYIVVDDPTTGILIKIPGEIQADPSTGRLTAVVDNGPQFPFSELQTKFFGGPRAALRTPSTCGSFTVGSQLTPWSAPQSGPPATPSSSIPVSSGAGDSVCPASEAAEPDRPSFGAGTTTPIAGAYSPFVLKLARADGSQPLSRIDATLPEGLLGKLAGVSYCSDAAIKSAEARGGLGQGATEQSSPSCPASSEVGTVTVGAGAGPQPYYASGHAYLAGPYKGAPLSLVVITPAVAGPFDLGSVVVRNALYVNETTAQIHAVSDPFPTILHGIPLDLRSIALNMNRPNFTLNPTSCEPKQIIGTAISTLGAAAPLAQRFQVGACNALGFKPSLKLSLKGATKRSGVPALKAVLTYPKGNYANIKSVSAVLPKSEFIDNAHIGNTCTRVQFNAGAGQGAQCPANSLLGHAIAYSPLLDKPLEGNVYLRSNGGERELPDIVAALKGQIPVTLVGFIDSVKKNKHSEVSRLRTRFMNVPDAPVSRFVLQLAGAKKGLLENSANLCKVKNIAQVKATAQNGKTYDTEPAVANDCGKKGKGKKKGTGKR
jgi:hypothetical protein